MRSLLPFVLLGWLAGLCVCQMQFLTPNPNNQDFSKTWSNGDVIDIKWNKTWKGLGDPLKRVDLWITWFDEDSFSQLLQSNITFETDGELKWTANLSDAVLKHTPRYVFRLKPHTDPALYSNTKNESPSRGFNLIPATGGTPTSVSSASTASSTSTSTSAPAHTTTAASNDSHSSLSTGAIVGIAIGGVTLIALFAFGAWFLLRYRRNANAAANGGAFEKDGTGAMRVEAGGVNTAYKPHVYAGTYMPLPVAPVEADGRALMPELSGNGNEGPRGYAGRGH